MKYLFLSLLLIPAMLFAQTDQKYLAGAVPEKEGKVVFSKNIASPSYTKDQIYDSVLKWAKSYFNGEMNRVVYSDKSKSVMAILGETELVFSNSLLSLDKTQMSYRLTVECKDHECDVNIRGIKYKYYVSYQKEPEKYIAEEWITDEYALSRGKLSYGNGKFRRHTIDFVDDLFDKLVQAANGEAVTTSDDSKEDKSSNESAQEKRNDGLVSLKPANIPSTISQLLPSSEMKMIASNGKEAAAGKAVWKGISEMFGKKVATIAIDPDDNAYKAVGENDTYKLTFVNEEGIWFVLDCRKQGETDNEGKKNLIGEIISAWIK